MYILALVCQHIGRLLTREPLLHNRGSNRFFLNPRESKAGALLKHVGGIYCNKPAMSWGCRWEGYFGLL